METCRPHGKNHQATTHPTSRSAGGNRRSGVAAGRQRRVVPDRPDHRGGWGLVADLENALGKSRLPSALMPGAGRSRLFQSYAIMLSPMTVIPTTTHSHKARM